MKAVLAIAKRELYAYFASPVAYVLLAGFYALSGYFFFYILAEVSQMALVMMVMSQQSGQMPPAMDMTTMVLGDYFSIVSMVFLFFIPMMTMGLISKEKRRGTIELLFTAPLSNRDIVTGKFMAALLCYTMMLLPTMIYSLVLYMYSEPKPLVVPMLLAYLGAYLLGGAILAIGMLLSSLTEHQLIAAVLSYIIVLFLVLLRAVTDAETGFWNELANNFSLLTHFSDFTKGIVDFKHVLYYISWIVFALAAAATALEARRWRP
jgi:ABC-2 type transport system permease protein